MRDSKKKATLVIDSYNVSYRLGLVKYRIFIKIKTEVMENSLDKCYKCGSIESNLNRV